MTQAEALDVLRACPRCVVTETEEGIRVVPCLPHMCDAEIRQAVGLSGPPLLPMLGGRGHPRGASSGGPTPSVPGSGWRIFGARAQGSSEGENVDERARRAFDEAAGLGLTLVLVVFGAGMCAGALALVCVQWMWR